MEFLTLCEKSHRCAMCICVAETELVGKSVAPPTPTMYKFRPSGGLCPDPGAHYHPGTDKISIHHFTETSVSNDGDVGSMGSCRVSDMPDYRSPLLHKVAPEEPSSHRSPVSGKLAASQPSESRHPGAHERVGHCAVTSGLSRPIDGVIRNPALQAAPLAEPETGYHSPYLSARTRHGGAGGSGGGGGGIVGGGEDGTAVGTLQSLTVQERSRDPSPVRYDNLSRQIMASIQERREQEEKERELAHSGYQGHNCRENLSVATESSNTSICSDSHDARLQLIDREPSSRRSHCPPTFSADTHISWVASTTFEPSRKCSYQ
uniref:Uncharacterized protein n=1 Tax=Eptatretus burgeri TaxID=7764 RepID=A0A8C4RD42_EPTBU